jgi:hypothetical protein
MPLDLEINIVPRNKEPASSTRKPHAHHHKSGALQRHLSRRVNSSKSSLPSRFHRPRQQTVQVHGALRDGPPPPYSILAPTDRLIVAHPSPPSLHRPHLDHAIPWDRLYSPWELTHVPRMSSSTAVVRSTASANDTSLRNSCQAAHPAGQSMPQAACMLLLVFLFGIYIC